MWMESAKNWYYPDIEPARRPILHSSEAPVIVFTSLPDLTANKMLLEAMDDTDNSESSISSSSSIAAAASSLSSKLKRFSQGQLNDLVCDLGLSNKSSQIFASRFGAHGILALGNKITFYLDRDNLLIRFFIMEDGFVYCNKIQVFLSEMGLPEYNSDEWRLFIDSSKWSLKCVLLHNGNKFACLLIGHSVIVKEHHLNVKMILQKLRYSEHN